MTTRASRSRGMPRHRSAPSPPRRERRAILAGAIVALIAVAALIAVLLSSTASSTLVEPAARGDRRERRRAARLLGRRRRRRDRAAAPDPDRHGPGWRADVDRPRATDRWWSSRLAHWCPSCQAEVPRLVDYLDSTGMPEGVRIVALSTSIDAARPNYPPSAWLDREEWTAPTMIDDATSGGLTRPRDDELPRRSSSSTATAGRPAPRPADPDGDVRPGRPLAGPVGGPRAGRLRRRGARCHDRGACPPPASATDRLGRPLHDLRISVTDRCNFRCTYCMPKEVFGADHAFLPRAEILDFEEIERVVRAAVGARRPQGPAHRRRAARATQPRDAGRACWRRSRASTT